MLGMREFYDELTPHRERDEHLGEMQLYVQDMQAEPPESSVAAQACERCGLHPNPRDRKPARALARSWAQSLMRSLIRIIEVKGC